MSMSRFLAALAVLMLLAAGCGAGAAPDEEAFPVTVPSSNGAVTLSEPPGRIISLSPTATETLFAIGAGTKVVAVDDQSNYPPQAPQADLSGLEPNLEAIASHRPDLVVVSDQGPSDLTDGLARLDVAVLAQPAAEDLADAYQQVRDLGAATGTAIDAALVVDQMRSEIEELLSSVPDGRSVRVFHQLSPDLYTASSDTFIGSIYQRLGLENVADRAAERAGTEYPQMSPEAVVAADPDLIVLADGQTPERASERAGWQEISAVRRGTIVAVDEDVSSRWGPRISEFVEAVVRAIEELRQEEQEAEG